MLAIARTTVEAVRDPLFLSPEDYLAGELASPIRREYRDGAVVAMAGGTQVHATIALNLATLLKGHLRGSGCRAFVENMRVRVEAANAFYYPDVVVTCDDRDRQPQQSFIQYPQLIIEVLSPSTEALDRGEKFSDYRTLPTLEEYAVVFSDRWRVDCYRKAGADRRSLQNDEAPEATVRLASVGLDLAIAELYEDTAIAPIA